MRWSFTRPRASQKASAGFRSTPSQVLYIHHRIFLNLQALASLDQSISMYVICSELLVVLLVACRLHVIFLFWLVSLLSLVEG